MYDNDVKEACSQAMTFEDALRRPDSWFRWSVCCMLCVQSGTCFRLVNSTLDHYMAHQDQKLSVASQPQS